LYKLCKKELASLKGNPQSGPEYAQKLKAKEDEVQELSKYLDENKPQLYQLLAEIEEYEKRIKSESSPTQAQVEQKGKEPSYAVAAPISPHIKSEPSPTLTQLEQKELPEIPLFIPPKHEPKPAKKQSSIEHEISIGKQKMITQFYKQRKRLPTFNEFEKFRIEQSKSSPTQEKSEAITEVGQPSSSQKTEFEYNYLPVNELETNELENKIDFLTHVIETLQ